MTTGEEISPAPLDAMLTGRARRLRTQATDAERALWRLLRSRQISPVKGNIAQAVEALGVEVSPRADALQDPQRLLEQSSGPSQVPPVPGHETQVNQRVGDASFVAKFPVNRQAFFVQ